MEYGWFTAAPPQLSEEELMAKLRRYKETRDAALRDELVTDYAHLVERIARRFSSYSEPVEDLIQEGFIGLIKAVEQFDPDKGVKFITYATHIISGEIRHYLRDLGQLIKEPAWLQELRFRINRASDQLTYQLGRPPTVAEVAERLGLEEREVADVLRVREVFHVESLDEPMGDDEEFDLLSVFDDGEIAPGKSPVPGAPIEERIVLRQAIARLKELERKAIVYFFYREFNKTEIARKLGISVNYVSYLVKRGLKHLHEHLVAAERHEALLRVKAMQERVAAGMEVAPVQPARLTDVSTGFLSRRQFLHRLKDEIARARRYPQEFSVVFILLRGEEDEELTWENLFSTQELNLIAQTLREALRNVDVLYRSGPQEFAAVLPNTGRSSSIPARRMRQRVLEVLDRHCPEAVAEDISFVYTIVVYPHDGTTTRELMATKERLQQSS